MVPPVTKIVHQVIPQVTKVVRHVLPPLPQLPAAPVPLGVLPHVTVPSPGRAQLPPPTSKLEHHARHVLPPVPAPTPSLPVLP